MDPGQHEPAARLFAEQEDIVGVKCLRIFPLRLDLFRDDFPD